MHLDNHDQIRVVLSRQPELSTIEDAVDYCKSNGIEARFWSVYFAARSLGRKLVPRSPKPFGESDLRDLALSFFAMHKCMNEAVVTLDELQMLNNSGILIDWQQETASAKYGWELSIAQEFVHYTGSIAQARLILSSL